MALFPPPKQGPQIVKPFSPELLGQQTQMQNVTKNITKFSISSDVDMVLLHGKGDSSKSERPRLQFNPAMCGLCMVPSNRWTGSTKQFQFYKYYFRVSRLVALLSVQTARQTATHRSNQPGLSSNAVVFSTKTFSVSAFNAFSSALPGENKAKRGGEERPTNEKTIEG